MDSLELDQLSEVAKKFLIGFKIINMEKINLGNINCTYIIQYLNKEDVSKKIILQSINDSFNSVDLLNFNHNLVTDHLESWLNNELTPKGNRRWEVPSLIKCQSNGRFDLSLEGKSWRAMKFIESSFSISSVKDLRYAYEVGYGLAKFHHIFSDYDSSTLKITMDNFHNTKHYLREYYLFYERFVTLNWDPSLLMRIEKINQNIQKNSQRIISLYDSLNSTSSRKQVIHGDPKLENFLFDKTRSVVSLIDLDTVYSGNLLTDLSDCLRSLCNPLGEDYGNLDDLFFDMNICREFLFGYVSKFDFNIKSINSGLLDSIFLIIFELVIRFTTDFFKSNAYFKVNYPTHNIDRAEVQLKILESLLSQRKDFIRLLNEIA